MIGCPYRWARSSKCNLVASYVGSYLCTKISGLGLSREASCDQKRGIDPRICTTALILPLQEPASSSNTICSVSTSLATFPWSFTPLFRYLVPAKCRDLLEMRTTFISLPKIDNLTCLKCPWTRATVQRVLWHLDRIGSVRNVFQTNKFS
uniref:Uncharacterized protein n=1 Tax=Arundo donax TaxID=35708 RepID=A0A0A9E427_ARUDO